MINKKGVLLTGPSASGKTSLALHLLKRCYNAEILTQIIADDQVFLKVKNNVLIGYVPDTLKGKIELRGFGIVDFPIQETEAKIVLHVALKASEKARRMHIDDIFEFENVRIKSLSLPAHQLEITGNAILACLGYPIWI